MTIRPTGLFLLVLILVAGCAHSPNVDEGNLSTKTSDKQTDAHGNTPLILAVKDNDATRVKQLLHQGGTTDVNEKNRHGNPALFYALVNRPEPNVDIISGLLDAGADVNGRTGESRWSPLHLLVTLKEMPVDARLRIGRILLAAGADPNLADHRGNTALMRAVLSNQVEYAQLLLDSGADPNIASDMGWTPLISAINEGAEELVEALLKAKADTEFRTKEEQITPLEVLGAVSEKMPVHKQLRMARLLVAAGAQVNGTAPFLGAPLDVACYARNKPLFDYLISAGAKPILSEMFREGECPV